MPGHASELHNNSELMYFKKSNKSKNIDAVVSSHVILRCVCVILLFSLYPFTFSVAQIYYFSQKSWYYHKLLSGDLFLNHSSQNQFMVCNVSAWVFLQTHNADIFWCNFYVGKLSLLFLQHPMFVLFCKLIFLLVYIPLLSSQITQIAD